MNLKKNVIANYCGQGWRALMGLVFVPVYIKFLGIEAYGLIGIFAILQAWLTLLDMGMTPALSREMARFTAGAHNTESIRDLLRSLEVIGFGIAAFVMLGIWEFSPWLASAWLKTEHISTHVVAHALTAMGIVTGLRFIENIYTSSVAGLQLQVLQNVVTSLISTTRALGAIAVLAWVSPSIELFFLWQCLISLITIPVLASLVYKTFPPATRTAHFSLPALRRVWRFAAGMMAITLLSLLLSQIDKILLTRLLSLTDFGYYALAGVIANTLLIFAAPVNGAFYPRFTELATCHNEPGLVAAYHQAAQLVTVVVGSAAVISIVFGQQILMLWSGDLNLAQHVAPLLSVMTTGTLLNALMGIPYEMQLAHGWTSLVIRVNVVAVLILVPAIFWIAPRYGAIGTAWLWVILNSGYLVFVIYFMHQQILKKEALRWYSSDLAFPLLAASVSAVTCKVLMPENPGKLVELLFLVISGALVFFVSASAAPLSRRLMLDFVQRKHFHAV